MESNRYKKIILPQAKEDIDGILRYISISEDLHNPTAAGKLFAEMLNVVDSIAEFPFSMPTIKDEKITLGAEYRRAEVRNFVLMYKVAEEEKEVRVMAAYYGPSDVVARLLKRI